MVLNLVWIWCALHTLEDVCDLITRAHVCSIDRPVQAQHLLHSLGVALHKGVGLSRFVGKHLVALLNPCRELRDGMTYCM